MTKARIPVLLGGAGLLFTSLVFAAPEKKTQSPFSSPTAMLELERLDTRTPVPLSPAMAHHQLQNMREHLEAVSGVVLGLARDDYGAVEKAARKMGYTEEMKAMCSHMGAGAPGFADRAIAFHKSADTIAEAAKFKDRAGVLRSLDATLQMCTSCHTQFRQQVVETAGGPGHGAHHAPP